MHSYVVALYERTAALVFAVQRNRALSLSLLAALLLAIGALMLARPTFNEDTRVYDLRLRDISTTSVGRYVRVNGAVMPQSSYQTQFNLGGLQLTGSRFIPMTGEGAYDPLYVLDQNLPPVPAEGGQITLTGKIVVGTGQQPAYFLEIGDPPDVVLMNAIARAGAVLLAALLAAAAIGWYVRRADYALSVPEGPPGASQAPELLWFGVLGRAYGDIAVRQTPAALTVNRSEARFQSLDQEAPWSVIVRRLVAAEPTFVATRYGALPAARLEFEDERGLRRRAVAATRSRAARDGLIDSLRFVGGGG